MRHPSEFPDRKNGMDIAKWKRVADRLARMDRAELKDRACQEFGKRRDGLLAVLGYEFSRHINRSGRSRGGNFFFAPDDVAQRLDLLRERTPGQVDAIVRQAEKILQHRFDLLGYEDLAYGSPIDWHLDLVHGKRAPRKLFYRVGYLDFREAGDSKITWELNRHQHFVTLAKAYRLTGDIRFPDEILRQWRHWWAENPYGVGINWASSLEAGFRSLSWLWTYYLLEGAPGLPDFREEWLRGLALHGRHIERYLSTYFSPNTHLLGEGVALFFLGVLCPELADAGRWKSTGFRVILGESRRQVRADGFHFEQSTYYHIYALDLFLHSAILATINDIQLPAEFEQTVEKMLNALCLLGRAGDPPRFGDDDGGRLFDPRRNRSEHMLDPLATGAILFNRGDFKGIAADLREETIWLLGPDGVGLWDQLEATKPDMNSSALTTTGFYLMTSEKPSSQLVVDCGPLGTQSGGHGHADALSVTLQSKGHHLLVDPGTFEYVGEERNVFRGTGMHNTVKVDGLDQAEPATAFSWRALPKAKADLWIQGASFDLLAGSHDGYQRLIMPSVHQRWVLSLRNGIYVILDRVEGEGKHHLELAWHLGPELQLVEEGLFRVKGASHGLALLPAQGHGWAEEVRRQSWSPVYGQKAPATVAVFSTSAELPREFCTLLVTLDEALQRPGKFERIDDQSEPAVRSWRFSGGEEEHHFFFSPDAKAWRHSGVSSDAEFVCRSRSKKGRQRLILVNGSCAEVEGAEIRFKRPISWGELVVDKDRREVFSSEPDAVRDEPAVSLQVNPDSSSSS